MSKAPTADELELMPLEQLRQLANAQIASEDRARELTPAELAEQSANTDGLATNPEAIRAAQNPARDPATGKFVSPNGETPGSEETPAEEVDEIVYRQVIDIGDGAGVQVFEAPTLEELVQKLATAQENATRKIREFARATPKKTEIVQNNADDEWLISQQFLTKPNETFKKLFEAQVGMPIEEFKSTAAIAQAWKQSQEEDAAVQAFIAAHPEFHRSPANGLKIERYIRTYQLKGTLENIEQAYRELSEGGLLEEAPATPTAATGEGNDGSERIATPVVKTSVQRRASSGISSKRSVATVNRVQEPTEEELYSMPLDKLEQLAREAAAKSRQ